MDTLVQDFRYVLRTLSQKPAFAIVTVLVLSLGIGLNTAVFSVVQSVLLRALPYADADRLVFIHHGERKPASPLAFGEWRAWNAPFDHLTAAEYWTPNLTGRDRPEQIFGVRATGELFELLGTPAALGRVFAAAEGQPGAAPVVVLSHRLWQRRFGSDPGILGETLALDGVAHTVVGVMPRDFEFPMFWATRAEVWAPLDLSPRATSRGESLRVFGRLRSDVSLERAQAEMDAIARRQDDASPDRAALAIVVSSLRTVIVGDVRPMLLILLAAVGLVLLIACVNVGGLLLSRASSRRGEIAIRQAVGASRGRIVRQLLSESLVLACLGGAVGLLAAAWGVEAFVDHLPAGTLPRQGTIGLDVGILAFTLVTSLVTGVVFGLAPAWGASGLNVSDALCESGRGSGSGRGESFRRALVVAEIALSLTLLVGAGLLIRSFVRLQSIEPGFSPDRVLTMTVSVTGTDHSVKPQRVAFFRDLIAGAEALPGVESASAINHLPLNGDLWGFSFSIEGRPEEPGGRRPNAAYRVVRPGYFRTMGIPIIGGRDFSERDDEASPLLVAINQTFARRLWPGADPLGRRIKVGGLDSSNPWMTVAAVVADTRQQQWAEPPQNEVYVPWLQETSFLADPASHFSYMTVVVRAAGDPAALAPIIQRLVWDIDEDVAVSAVATMTAIVADEVWTERVSMVLMGTFALAALLMASVGIFGVLSHAVQQRRREIGIRLALGARPRRILAQVLWQGATLSAIGIAVGLPVALQFSGLLANLLFDVGTRDVWTFATTALALAFVALGASWIPARRAMRVDPMSLLRR